MVITSLSHPQIILETVSSKETVSYKRLKVNPASCSWRGLQGEALYKANELVVAPAKWQEGEGDQLEVLLGEGQADDGDG